VEYDPQPPFDCGSVETASAELVTSMRALRGFIINGAPQADATVAQGSGRPEERI
jgi:hypothetical protein